MLGRLFSPASQRVSPQGSWPVSSCSLSFAPRLSCRTPDGTARPNCSPETHPVPRLARRRMHTQPAVRRCACLFGSRGVRPLTRSPAAPHGRTLFLCSRRAWRLRFARHQPRYHGSRISGQDLYNLFPAVFSHVPRAVPRSSTCRYSPVCWSMLLP